MSTIVFFCIPAYGHTNPTLGVVRELAARGHKVVYYSYDTMRKPIEAAARRLSPATLTTRSNAFPPRTAND